MKRLYGEIIFLICCFLGFLFQVYHVSAIYFSYGTNTRVEGTILENLTSPDVAVCVEYADVLDWESYRREYNSNHRLPTTGDILRFTPAVNDTIKSSFHRAENVFRIIRTNDSYRYFTVRKFFVDTSICYAVALITNPRIYFPKVTLSLEEQGIFYGIELSEKLNRVSRFTAIVYYGGLPYTSKSFSPSIDRRWSALAGMVSEYTLTFIRYAVNVLEKPYDTACEKGTGKKTRCKSECITDRLESINRVPFQIVTTEGSDKPPVNQQDMEDEEKGRIIHETFDYCTSLCTFGPCHFDYTTTTLAGEKHSLHPGDRSTSLWIRVRTPAAPGLNIHTDPKITLTEYLIYVCSSFGIWFGLSVYSLNPLRLITMHVKRWCRDEGSEGTEEPDRIEVRARVWSRASITIIVERNIATRRPAPDPIAGCI